MIGKPCHISSKGWKLLAPFLLLSGCSTFRPDPMREVIGRLGPGDVEVVVLQPFGDGSAIYQNARLILYRPAVDRLIRILNQRRPSRAESAETVGWLDFRSTPEEQDVLFRRSQDARASLLIIADRTYAVPGESLRSFLEDLGYRRAVLREIGL